MFHSKLLDFQSLTGWWFGCHFLLSHQYWVSHHPNWRTPILQRGGPTTNQYNIIPMSTYHNKLYQYEPWWINMNHPFSNESIMVGSLNIQRTEANPLSLPSGHFPIFVDLLGRLAVARGRGAAGLRNETLGMSMGDPQGIYIKDNMIAIKNWLVVWLPFSIFPYIGNHHPNWLIFFRGVAQPPTRKKYMGIYGGFHDWI